MSISVNSKSTEVECASCARLEPDCLDGTRVIEDDVPAYLVEGALNHLSDLRGFDVVRNEQISRGFVRNALVVPEGATNLFGNAHGGFALALIDVAACMAAYTLGKSVVTMQCSCSFMRPLRIGDAASVEAEVIKDGRSTIIVRVEIIDSEGQLCVSSLVSLFSVGHIGAADPIPQPFFPRNDMVAL